MTSIEIINSIVEKGGLLGSCAKRYKDDEGLTDQFIHECFDYCKHPMALTLWGEALINEIVTYVLEKEGEKAVTFPGAIEV